MALVRFESGKWVEPDSVLSVIAEDRVKGENPSPPRVIIKKLDDEDIILNYKTFRKAIIAADTIADIINGCEDGGPNGGDEMDEDEEVQEGNLVKFPRVTG